MAKHTRAQLEKIIALRNIESQIEAYIRSTVQTHGYDNENSIAKYLVAENPFYAECKSISLWIGDVWTTALQIKADVESNSRSLPDDIVGELPALSI